MRFSSATAASAFASILLLSGILLSACGGSGDEETEPPDDFAIAVQHVDGSTPPPDHTEWTLTFDDDLQATLAYTAGYPGPDTPAYKAQFDVEGAARFTSLHAYIERPHHGRAMTGKNSVSVIAVLGNERRAGYGVHVARVAQILEHIESGSAQSHFLQRDDVHLHFLDDSGDAFRFEAIIAPYPEMDVVRSHSNFALINDWLHQRFARTENSLRI